MGLVIPYQWRAFCYTILDNHKLNGMEEKGKWSGFFSGVTCFCANRIAYVRKQIATLRSKHQSNHHVWNSSNFCTVQTCGCCCCGMVYYLVLHSNIYNILFHSILCMQSDCLLFSAQFNFTRKDSREMKREKERESKVILCVWFGIWKKEPSLNQQICLATWSQQNM